MRRICVLAPVIASMFACGQNTSDSTSSSDGSGDKAAAYDEIVEPPKEYYDAALLDNMANLHLAGTTDPVLYVNFNGATLTKGYQIGQSFILCSRQATVPAANFSPSEQEDIRERVQKFFDDAGTNLQVVIEEPVVRPYTTLMVGGSYGDLGCIDSRGVLGIAPFDRGNTNKNDIGFAFTKYYNSVRVAAETIAHEAGHSYGLDHVRERHGLMYAANSSQIIGFIDGTTTLGRSQNEPIILQTDVGKAVAGTKPDPIQTNPNPISSPAPTPAPAPNAPNRPNTPTIPGLDQLGGLGDLLSGLIPGQIGGGLDLDSILGGIGGLFPGLGQGQFPDLSAIGGLAGLDDLLGLIGLAGQVPPGTNLPGGLGPIKGITDLLGGLNGNLGGLDALIGLIPGAQGGGLDLSSLLGNLNGLFRTGSLPAGVPSFSMQGNNLPDFAGILELDQIKDLPTLFRTLDQHAAYVNQNYSGHERDTLLTALKLGYAQAYSGLK